MNDVALATRVVAFEETAQPTPYKLVTHQRPDTDAWACLWGAAKFIAKNVPYEICFVPAGDRLTQEEEENYRVVYMDTGKSFFDQHERELKRTSSFKLMCEGLLIHNDPALQPIIELTVATDNVEAISRTSVHYILKGLAHHYKDTSTGKIDWASARHAAFALLDILYDQACERGRNCKIYEEHKEGRSFLNGIKVAALWNRPATMDAAYEDGNDVVVAFVRRGKRGFYPLIQTNRNSPVKLDRIAFAIRVAEAKKRGVQTKGVDLWAIGSNPLFGGWFFHDSHKLLACGTRGHELERDEEFTKLSTNEIMGIVYKELSSLPPLES